RRWNQGAHERSESAQAGEGSEPRHREATDRTPEALLVPPSFRRFANSGGRRTRKLCATARAGALKLRPATAGPRLASPAAPHGLRAFLRARVNAVVRRQHRGSPPPPMRVVKCRSVCRVIAVCSFVYGSAAPLPRSRLPR